MVSKRTIPPHLPVPVAKTCLTEAHGHGGTGTGSDASSSTSTSTVKRNVSSSSQPCSMSPSRDRHPRLNRPTSSTPLLPEESSSIADKEKAKGKGRQAAAMAKMHSSWLFYALASGACAAFNGVFAKLTTTELTTTIAASIANLIGLSPQNHITEYLIRALFFTLNLAFNALMWVLFTRALTRHPSTTRVSIMNTSANFMVTACLGAAIFSELLPPLWFLGAAMLVIGNVIIGRRDGDGEKDEEGDVEGDEESARSLLAEDDEDGLSIALGEDGEEGTEGIFSMGDRVDGRERVGEREEL